MVPRHLLPFTLFQDIRPYECLTDHYDFLDDVFTPWYATYGLHDIPLLFTDLPYMRRLTIAHAVRFGRLNVLAFLHRHFDICTFDGDWIDTAAHFGQLPVVQFLHAHGHSGATYFALDDALIQGHLNVANFLWTYRRSDGSSTRAWEGSAERGQLKSIQWLHAHDVWLCTPETMDRAAEAGHLEIVKYLDTHRSEGCTDQAIVLAVKEGHIDVVQYLLDTKAAVGSKRETVTAAYDAGHLELVQLLLST
ncbi:unnamed protein product [Aphanomyces euteiches]|uniref:Uncharacterized protein n=1 Tax=Aphanomyces euteiches TaxID=100861 RepID=A0A6G0WFT2_9STRA|nr:hypothetical protein Ae201684_015733 [Aphanomyces euteiches]KAH9093648.1 hypothetical protein Ae201684P_016274 [Aphanomyces euteiches]KAH9134052.1 hypothetical protein AeRB84_020074 [Aphanomyces euteiches]